MKRLLSVAASLLMLAGTAVADPATAPIDQEQSQRRDAAYAHSREACILHSKAYANAALDALSVRALIGVTQRQILICPHTELPPSGAVIWYGNRDIILWNPEVPNAVRVMAKVLDDMAEADDYPYSIIPYDAESGRIGRIGMVPSIDWAVRPARDYPGSEPG
jgi:hypothetical protein